MCQKELMRYLTITMKRRREDNIVHDTDKKGKHIKYTSSSALQSHASTSNCHEFGEHTKSYGIRLHYPQNSPEHGRKHHKKKYIIIIIIKISEVIHYRHHCPQSHMQYFPLPVSMFHTPCLILAQCLFLCS